MKLSASIITLLSVNTTTNAQIGGGSKKRNALTRYGWKWPLCRDIDNCGCGGRIGSGSVKSGEITVGEVKHERNQTITSVPYGTKQKCMWHITVPKKHSIYMEFDKSFGFNVEYHNFCGFDKVHFFAGHYAPNQSVQRIGRFCGPRRGDQPWDGARKVFSETSMPFWDEPYNSNSNKITIAWDSDQTKSDLGGFKLKWWAVADSLEDKSNPFDTLSDSMRIMRGRIEPLIRAQMTVPHRVRDRQLKQLNNVLNNLETAVDEKGPNGEKSCSDMETFLKPDEQLRKILEAQHTLERWLAIDGPIVQYAEYYIGKCKNYKWDDRVQNIWKKTQKNIGTVRAIRFGGNQGK